MFTPYCQVNYSEQLASIKKKRGGGERERKKEKKREGREGGREEKEGKAGCQQYHLRGIR